MPNHPTLASLAADLDTGRTTARKLVEDCLARIADPAGEGARTFIHVDKDAAIAAADAMDRLRQARLRARCPGLPRPGIGERKRRRPLDGYARP